MDLLDGRVVRLTHGDYSRVRVYSEDPAGVLAGFHAAGAAYGHVVDLTGARDPAARQRARIEPLLKDSGLKVQIGGGVRTLADARQLLDWGADRVIVGSIVVTDPELGTALLQELGPDRMTFALDVSVGADHAAHVAIKGWSEITKTRLEEVVARFRPAGLKRVLCTDISRDGAANGPNGGLYRALAGMFPGLEVEASGGVRDLADLRFLKGTGAHSAIVGTARYEKTLDLKEALAEC
jgi:phosphoribosylformimino-5-aminoimidazole carboxamide ribotide isomerase